MDKVVADFLEGVLVCDRHGDEALTRSAVADPARLRGADEKQSKQRGGAEPTTIRMTASASASAPSPGSAVDET